MRLTTRTPPVRIAAADMVALAALPAEHAGLLLRWGMRLYGDGERLTVDQAMADARLDTRGMSVLLDGVRGLLDPAELAQGRIAVRCFAEAAAARDRVGVARVRARAVEGVRAETAVASGAAVRPARRSRPSEPELPFAADRGPPAPPSSRPAPEPVPDGNAPASGGREEEVDAPSERDAIVAALVHRGVAGPDAVAASSRWIATHGLRETYDAVAALADRRIAKVVAYVDRVLDNARTQRSSDMPSAILMANRGGALPRPIRRRIQVGPRASWEFLGWTARGHGRDGGTREARREVWRTDAGTLAFQDAPAGKIIPDYSEDPGVYDHE